jgi:uncharacterized phage-associated protein
MNIKKIITILDYFADRLGPITKLKIVKLLFFLDKFHFKSYGRFITKDDYIHLPYGPIPTRILDIINEPSFNLDKSDLAYLKKILSIDLTTKNRTIRSIRRPDLDELSKSEIKAIDSIIEKYGPMTESALVDLTHKESAYSKTGSNEKLRVEDLLDGMNENKKRELLNLYKNDCEIDRALHGMAC